jgi:hypothetical protein
MTIPGLSNLTSKPRVGPKRSEEQRSEDLILMQRLYLQGWSRAELAEKFGISVKQIDYDLKKIRKESQRERSSEVEEARGLARQRARMVMRMAWKAFEKSKYKVVKCRACHSESQTACAVCKGMGVVGVEVPGDPNFLRFISKVLSDLRKLDGLDVPVNAPNHNTHANFTLDELIRRQEQERARNG